jgi:hypothetical protein
MIGEPAKIEPASVNDATPLGIEFRHDWKTIPEQRLAHTEFADGNARTLRTCAHCGLVKITVHFAGGSQAERRWRRPGRSEFFTHHTPSCPGPKPQGDVGAEPTKLVTGG